MGDGAIKKKKTGRWWGLAALILALGLALWQGERRVLPVALALAEAQARQRVTLWMDEAVEKAETELGLSAAALLGPGPGAAENAFTVDAMAVNRLAVAVSRNLNERLLAEEAERVGIPLGAALGPGLWAERGPRLWFSLRPAGACTVDYGTEFTAVGINQTHFQAYVEARVSLRLVNPLGREEIQMSRRVVLVETVLSGRVPEKYFYMNP